MKRKINGASCAVLLLVFVLCSSPVTRLLASVGPTTIVVVDLGISEPSIARATALMKDLASAAPVETSIGMVASSDIVIGVIEPVESGDFLVQLEAQKPLLEHSDKQAFPVAVERALDMFDENGGSLALITNGNIDTANAEYDQQFHDWFELQKEMAALGNVKLLALSPETPTDWFVGHFNGESVLEMPAIDTSPIAVIADILGVEAAILAKTDLSPANTETVLSDTDTPSKASTADSTDNNTPGTDTTVALEVTQSQPNIADTENETTVLSVQSDSDGGQSGAGTAATVNDIITEPKAAITNITVSDANEPLTIASNNTTLNDEALSDNSGSSLTNNTLPKADDQVTAPTTPQGKADPATTPKQTANTQSADAQVIDPPAVNSGTKINDIKTALGNIDRLAWSAAAGVLAGLLLLLLAIRLLRRKGTVGITQTATTEHPLQKTKAHQQVQNDATVARPLLPPEDDNTFSSTALHSLIDNENEKALVNDAPVNATRPHAIRADTSDATDEFDVIDKSIDSRRKTD